MTPGIFFGDCICSYAVEQVGGLGRGIILLLLKSRRKSSEEKERRSWDFLRFAETSFFLSSSFIVLVL